MAPKDVTKLAEFLEIIGGEKYSIFDFHATWCGPCKAIAPTFAKLDEETADVDFYRVDVDAAPEIAQEVGVTAMPTFVLFKDGGKVDTLRGAVPPKLTNLVKNKSAA